MEIALAFIVLIVWLLVPRCGVPAFGRRRRGFVCEHGAFFRRVAPGVHQGRCRRCMRDWRHEMARKRAIDPLFSRRWDAMMSGGVEAWSAERDRQEGAHLPPDDRAP